MAKRYRSTFLESTRPKSDDHGCYITARDTADPNEAYFRLAVAIVEQAAKDANGYSGWAYGARKSTRDNLLYSKEFNRNWQREEVKRFFYDIDGIFPMCMPNTDGPALYKMIMHNYEVYGNYVPPQINSIYGGGILL